MALLLCIWKALSSWLHLLCLFLSFLVRLTSISEPTKSVVMASNSKPQWVDSRVVRSVIYGSKTEIICYIKAILFPSTVFSFPWRSSQHVQIYSELFIHAIQFTHCFPLKLFEIFKSKCTEISRIARPRSQFNSPFFRVYKEVFITFQRFRGLFF